MGSLSKTAASGPSEVTDCGVGRARLQLTREATAGGPSNTLHNPGLQCGEIKPQTAE